MPTSDQGQSARRWHATCLVVAADTDRARGPGTVAALIDSLIRRELTVRRCEDGYAAMAELVLHERAARRQPNADPLVVVIVDPATMPHASALFEAGIRHAPRAIFWEYQTGPSGKLAAYRPETSESPRKPAPFTAAPARPTLRLTPEHDEAETTPGAAAQIDRPRLAEPASLVLSDDELSMLLGEGPAGRSRGSGA
jgi:hypothetical protein